MDARARADPRRRRALGAQYSQAFSGALGTTAGTIVHDFPHLVDRFQEAQGGATVDPVTPAPAPAPGG